MNYKYRITLAGIKGFFRVYSVNASNTLYTFHKQIRADLEFPVDQPILFKGLDGDGNVVGRWALVDLGAGTVDKVKISDTVKAGVKSFVYFYDIASKSYEVGKTTFTDLNNTELTLTQTRLQQVQAIYNFVIAKAGLEQTLGYDFTEEK